MTDEKQTQGFETVLEVIRGRSGLVCSGLNIPEDSLFKTGQLEAYCPDTGEKIPFWWDARSFWPDGSIRWIFFHALTLPGSGKIAIRTCDRSAAHEALSAYPECEVRQADDRSVNSPDFSVFLNDRPIMTIRTLIPECPDRSTGERFCISTAEASPFAPLFRVSGTQNGLISTEYLIRADLTSGIYIITCRHSLRYREVKETGELTTIVRFDEEYFGNTDAVISDMYRRGPAAIRRYEDEPCRIDFVLFPESSGKAGLKGGISLRQEYRIGPAGELTLSAVKMPPSLFADVIAPGVEKGLRRLFARAAERHNDPGRHRMNILDDGDWPLSPGQYGAKEYTGFADNEYDAPYAFYLAYGAFGEKQYLDIALRGSVHMADIDCMCDDGDMLYHGYDDEAEDHRLHRVNCGDLGHYWTDGLWTAYFMTGDIFAKEAAEALMKHIIRSFDKLRPEEAFAVCERNLGWPLMAAVSELETGLADVRVKGFFERMIAFADSYTADPDKYYLDTEGPLWWRCAFRDGSKPFMLGVLGEALDRYYELTGDERAAKIIIRISDFILDLFDPVRADFQYEFNAYGPGVREINAQQLIPLFIRTILSGAVLSNDEEKISKASASFHAAAWCLFDFETGKDIALMARGYFPAIEKMIRIYNNKKQKLAADSEPSDGTSPFEWIFDENTEPGYADFVPGVYSDRARLQIHFTSAGRPESTLNTQALVHLCDRLPFCSCVSVIFFYNRLQVRFYDDKGRLITSLDHFTDDAFFDAGKTHIIEIEYEAPGTAALRVDNGQAVTGLISRHVSGAFRSAMTGRRPGNWKVNGSVGVKAYFERSSRR